MLDIENGVPKCDLKPDKRMTGEERYPLMGDLITEEEAAEIMKRCKGLQFFGDCLRKNIVAAELLMQRLQGIMVCMGALEIKHTPSRSSYGFLHNPPYEFHAFIVLRRTLLIDVSLPGVILRAQQHGDEYGVWLDGLEPRIMAGDSTAFDAQYHYVVHRAMTLAEATYTANIGA